MLSYPPHSNHKDEFGLDLTESSWEKPMCHLMALLTGDFLFIFKGVLEEELSAKILRGFQGLMNLVCAELSFFQ